MLVSVVIPCHNDGRYIEETIRSVENQTYEEIEIVIIDDASTDEQTRKVLDKLSSKHRVIRFKENHGPSKGRNEAIIQSKGEIILCLDADDIIEPKYIEKGIEIFRSRPSVGVVYCRARYFDNRQGPWALPKYSVGRMLIENVIFISAMFRKDLWAKVGGFDEKMKWREDWDFWLSVIEQKVEVEMIDEVLFNYRIKAQSRDQSFMKNPRDVEMQTYAIRMKHRQMYIDHLDEMLMEMSACTYLHPKRTEGGPVAIFHRVTKPFKNAIGKIISQ